MTTSLPSTDECATSLLTWAWRSSESEVGLFTRALREHPDIELADSAVVGDGMSDMLAAARLAIPAYAIVDDASRAEFERAAREHGAAIGGSFPSLAALVRDGLGIEAA
jgi:histidinol phosphatase-like enzyme